MVIVYACGHEAKLKIREESGVREGTKQCFQFRTCWILGFSERYLEKSRCVSLEVTAQSRDLRLLEDIAYLLRRKQRLNWIMYVKYPLLYSTLNKINQQVYLGASFNQSNFYSILSIIIKPISRQSLKLKLQLNLRGSLWILHKLIK